MQCATGMAMYDAEYLRRARELCTRHGVHLIADEIAVGFGRTGTLFACEQAGIAPDFLCLSKGITGGFLPLSVVMTTDDVYAAFYDDATDARLPALALLHRQPARVPRGACGTGRAGGRGRARAQPRSGAVDEPRIAGLRDHPRVRHPRHLGMIWAFDLADEDPRAGRALHERALRAGLLLRPIGNTVYWMPPYAVGEAEMDLIARGVEALL